MKTIRFLLPLSLLLVSVTSWGQQTLDAKIKGEWVVPGSVILDGKEVHGYIKKMGRTSLGDEWFDAPWDFQQSIRFIEKKAFETAEKIKNKDYMKYDAKDVQGYKYNNDSLIFESVKYTDMSAVGAGMIPKTKFMKKVSDNKISIFHNYQVPPPVGEISSLKEIYIENQTPDLVYRIGPDGKLKLVNSLNIEKELSSCPVVVTKYKNNEYKAVGSEESQSNANKFLNKAIFRDAVRLMVIEDYNQQCK